MNPKPKPDHARACTWDDYRQLPDNERWELINGELYAMSPAPETRHQFVVRKFMAAFERHFEGKPCQPWVSPVDVRLADNVVVQPDLAIVCDPKQVKTTHLEGAPALVVEVLSPSTMSHDSVRKLQLYAAAGVREFWLVNPYPHLIQVLVLDDGHYVIQAAYQGKSGVAASITFPGLEVRLPEVFGFSVPPEEQILEVHEAEPKWGTARKGKRQ